MVPDRDKPPHEETPKERAPKNRKEIPDIHRHDGQHTANTS